MRVMLLNQVQLPVAMPALQLLLSQDRSFHSPRLLEMDEPHYTIARRETGHTPTAMLVQTRDQLGRNANIESPAWRAGEDIDARLAIHFTSPANAAGWMLKQVQHDEKRELFR